MITFFAFLCIFNYLSSNPESHTHCLSGLINAKTRLICCHSDAVSFRTVHTTEHKVPHFAHRQCKNFVEEMEVTRATIGSDAWKNASIRNIRLAQTVLNRSDKACELGQQLDPLPSLRDTSIQQSNARIHAYVRATRAVLVKLRESLLDTNEEIKSLLRGKEHLEKTLEHIRKDIILNTKSTMQRQTRPSREKVTRSSCLCALIPVFSFFSRKSLTTSNLKIPFSRN